MSEWKAKRFWTDVTIAAVDTGYEIRLDDRALRTPGKLPLHLPSRIMAEGIAAEWAAQEEEIAPLTMPMTRAANSAIERVTPQKAEVADMLAAYAETDLLCHRATSPEALQNRQAAAWDPLLDWAAERFGARLYPTEGILAVDQPGDSLKSLSAHLHSLSVFELTALHDLITISGSLVIGLAVAEGQISAETGWDLSRIDEDWQIEQWGRDEEAEAASAHKKGEFLNAEAFWHAATAK